MSDLNLPKVSCICPTFARVYLLEEAIESFLRQDYKGEKELIIDDGLEDCCGEFWFEVTGLTCVGVLVGGVL